jgi:hypothetical protein
MAIFADAVRPILDYAASHPIPTPYTPPVVETGILVGLTAGGGTLTFPGTTPANRSFITIGTKIYTFVTSTPGNEGEVLIGGSANAAATNLSYAINRNSGGGAGTGDGTLYKAAAANVNVSATNPVAKQVVCTARYLGAQYASKIITSASISPNSFGSWGLGVTTLTGGTDANLCNESSIDILIDIKP